MKSTLTSKRLVKMTNEFLEAWERGTVGVPREADWGFTMAWFTAGDQAFFALCQEKVANATKELWQWQALKAGHNSWAFEIVELPTMDD